MKKFTKKASAVLLALVMTVCLVSTAFAGNTVGTGTTTNDVAKGIVITSSLNIAPGVAVPAETFTYKFAQDTSDTTGMYQDTAAPISNVTVAFSAADRAATATEPAKLMKQAAVTLASYDRAGVYKYVVTEVAGSTSGMTYADNAYTLYVTVKNTGTGVAVDNVVLVPGNGDTTAAKADANPTDADSNSTPDYTENANGLVNAANGFEFVNSYTKVKGDTAPGQDKDVDPTDGTTNPDGTPGITDGNGDGIINQGDKVTDPDELAFGLSNKAANEDPSGLDLVDKKTPVEYTVKVTVPDTTPSTYALPDGIITDADGNIIRTVTPAADGTYDVELADGETFYIPNLPVGSKISVSETVPENTDPSYTGKNNGVDMGTNSYTAPVEVVVGDNGPSTVSFTNTYDNTTATPTGVILQNMPFIVMALIAVMGVALVVVSKRRRENEE